MSHLKGIGFENFRVFQNKTYFNFAPLTILTGTNSSGKSSVINGIKLLSESFKSINKQSSYDGRTLNLDALLLEPLDVSKILERYGSLNQFLNFKSDKKEFTFSFIQTPPLLSDRLEFTYTVAIEKNKLKTGRIKQIEVSSLEEKKVIFKVYETRTKLARSGNTNKIIKQHAFKVDLTYFIYRYDELIKRSSEYHLSRYNLNAMLSKGIDMLALEEAIRLHNKKYGDGCHLSTYEDETGGGLTIFSGDLVADVIGQYEGVEELVKESNNNIFPYDFSFLWKDDPVELANYLHWLDTNFNTGANSEYALQFYLLHVLSAVEWKTDMSYEPFAEDYPSADFYIQFPKDVKSDQILPFSLKEYIKTFVFQDIFFGDGKDEEMVREAVSNSINRAGLKRNKAIDEVFIPLLVKLSMLQYPQWGVEETKRIYSQSATEKYFYNGLLFQTLSFISAPVSILKRFSFIDAQRIQPKRTFSITQPDLFSRQIKSLFEMPEPRFAASLEFLSKWIREFKIADEIELHKDEDTENFKVYLNKRGERPVLLADYGFGTSQILPIIIELVPHPNTDYWDPYEHAYLPKFVCIEEPENSLHPALQSKLAEMFAEAIKRFNVQLIIETHSEYLIRKLQYLTAVKNHDFKLSPSSTQIYYFNHPDRVPEGEEQVKGINIKEDGFLTSEFGEGFFDESGRLMIELLKLQNQN